MAMMGALYLCLFFAMFSSINGDGGGACYAPPNFFGFLCRSSRGITGSPGLKVRYTIKQVNTMRTLICCKARACAPQGKNKCSSFGLYDIGCSSSTLIATVLWGNNIETPAIKCKGIPTGTSLIWSH